MRRGTTPTLRLALEDIDSNVCETGDGYIKFFAATNTGTITINSITCLKGGN